MTDESVNNKMETWQSYYTRVLSSDHADEFVSTLSHELRTPLTSIRGALGLLRSEMLDPKSKQGKRLLEIAVNNTDRLVHLTAALEQERDLFFRLSPDLLSISGFDGYFKRLNPSWEKTLGFTKEEFLAKPYIAFVHPEDQSTTLTAVERLLSGAESLSLENRYLCKDGSYKWFLWNAVTYAEEQLIYAIGRDITERKRTEWLLGAQHATTRVLAESTTTKEAMSNILQALCKSLGWQRGEFWSITPDHVLQCVETWSAKSVDGKDISGNLSTAISLAPGMGLPGRVWASGTADWITDVVQDNHVLRSQLAEYEGLHAAFGFPVISGDEILGVLTFFRQDIQPPDEDLLKMVSAIGIQIGQFIERQRAKEALQQSESQLREQTIQLQRALQKLKHTQAQLVQSEKMSALGQLVGGVAHEVNNPINFIYGNIEYINQYVQSLLHFLHLYAKYYPNPAPEIKAKAEEIDLDFIVEDLPKLMSSMKLGTERIRGIVLSLRNFSRLDESQKKQVNIHEGLDSTLVILQSQLIANSRLSAIEIIKDYGNLPLVDCYPGQLNQVFINIFSNALNALEEQRYWGAGKLENSQQAQQTNNSASYPPISLPPCIRIHTQVLDAHDIVIRIADNGCGMTELVKERIFDPFFTTQPVGKGTGLGLSICYQIIIEKHKGKLKCTSEPGKGTEFWIQIPIQQN
jgi:PAS domain S-box-containing protein